MDQVADELNLYGVEEVPQEAIDQAVVILRATGRLADAIGGLDGLKDVGRHLIDIHTLEDDGDRIVRDAVAALFANRQDALVVIRWKDIHEHLEQAIDSCERAAHVLESVYLKHTAVAAAGARAGSRKPLQKEAFATRKRGWYSFGSGP